MRDEPFRSISSVPHPPVSSGMVAGSSSFDGRAVVAHTQSGSPWFMDKISWCLDQISVGDI